MAEISTLNGYKIKDKKAIRYYNTVADMVADTTLKNGMHARTKGYYSINDGGGADYHITNIRSQENYQYQENLANSLYATLIIKELYVDLFGAVGDGVNDDTNPIKRALSYAKDNNLILKTKGKDYLINDDIIIDNTYFDLSDGSLITNNNITITNKSTFKNGTVLGGNLIVTNGKNNISFLTIKDWNNSAITINSSYEDFIHHIRLENDINSTDTVGITNNSDDETISDVYGYGAFKGIISNGSDCFYNNIHLWLNGNNAFTGSRFFEINKSLNSLNNICSDSYETAIYFTATFLFLNIKNLFLINNNEIFKNKSFTLVGGTTTNCVIYGNVINKLTGFSANNNTLTLGYLSNLNVRNIDGSPTNRIGSINYILIRSYINDNTVTVQEDSYIDVNEGKFRVNLTLYISGNTTNSITIDLSSYNEISKYKCSGFGQGVFNSYTKVGTFKYSLNNGNLTITIPQQETSVSSFSEISLNIEV